MCICCLMDSIVQWSCHEGQKRMQCATRLHCLLVCRLDSLGLFDKREWKIMGLLHSRVVAERMFLSICRWDTISFGCSKAANNMLFCPVLCVLPWLVAQVNSYVGACLMLITATLILSANSHQTEPFFCFSSMKQMGGTSQERSWVKLRKTFHKLSCGACPNACWWHELGWCNAMCWNVSIPVP